MTTRLWGLWPWLLVAAMGAGVVLLASRAEGEAGGPRACAGGLLDPATGLCWQNPAPQKSYSWDSAVAYCKTLSVSGQGPGSWHLPTISELRSLIRGCPATVTGGPCGVTDSCLREVCENDSCSRCPHLRGPGTRGAYWPAGFGGPMDVYWSSSSLAGDSSLVWAVYFTDGLVYYDFKNMTYPVRCVRSGP